MGDKKGCINTKNCSMLTTYIGESETSYMMEIFGLLDKNNDYIGTIHKLLYILRDFGRHINKDHKFYQLNTFSGH